MFGDNFWKGWKWAFDMCISLFIYSTLPFKGKPIVAMALALMALKMLQTYETCELLHVTLRTVAVGGHGEFIQGQVQGYRNLRDPAHHPQCPPTPTIIIRDKWWQNKPFHKACYFLCEGICIGGGSLGFPWMDFQWAPGLDCLLKAGNPECVVWFLAKTATSKTQRRFTGTFEENHHYIKSNQLKYLSTKQGCKEPPPFSPQGILLSPLGIASANRILWGFSWQRAIAESSWGCEKTWDRNIHPPFAKCSLEDLAICDFWHLLRLDDQRQNTQKSYDCPYVPCLTVSMTSSDRAQKTETWRWRSIELERRKLLFHKCWLSHCGPMLPTSYRQFQMVRGHEL